MSANPLISFLAWTFVPSVCALASVHSTVLTDCQYATSFLHSVYYSITIRAGEPKPAPGSPLYRKHYQRIYATLIIAYLGYTFLQVFHDLRIKSDFYTALGVPHDIDEKALKSRYRRLAAQFHPDKVGESGPAHEYYIFLQTASDTLLDPVQKFMYERFGPEIVKLGSSLPKQATNQLSTWMTVALRLQGPSYAGSLIMLLILGATGYMQYGRFWRFWAFTALLMVELYTVTRPLPPWVLTDVINPFLVRFANYPPLLQFQALALARKMTFNLFIAIAQLGPLLDTPGSRNAGTGKEVEPQQLAKLEQLLALHNAETQRLFGLAMAPFAGDDAAQREVKETTKNWLVQNTIRADPEVRQAHEQALRKRGGGLVQG